jgi:nitrogen fixation/metabolism regulation signal transduction histidine kinase
MILNSFFINIVVRVAFIVLSSIISGIILVHLDEGYYYTLSGISFLILLQTWLLIKKVNTTNNDLEKFLSSVLNYDSTIRFPGKIENCSFRKLHTRMNEVNSVIQNARVENERTGHFLQNVVDHVDIGLLAFDDAGVTRLYNSAAARYIKVQKGYQISALNNPANEIVSVVQDIKPGQEIMYKLKKNNILKSILIKATGLRFESHVIKLVSFQDITNELDKKELDSWQRLVRVLTHEIMNSISPIISLTTVISGYFKKKGEPDPIPQEKIDNHIISKTLSGLDTIEETGRGLMDFVENYRSLTSLPKPDLNKFRVFNLLLKCKQLMESGIPESIKITMSTDPEDIEIMADYTQVELVLINLIKNAADALSDRDNGIIQLKAFRSGDSTLIQVEDNGNGISPEIIEDIFMPFYTTKENGSGIGLSISRQIMQNHNGTILVNSSPGTGSKFTLNFSQY